MSDVPIDAWVTSTIEIGTPEQVHAYGVIALVYNRLEDFLIELLTYYFQGEEGPAKICAHMLNNRNRLDLTKALVEANEEDQSVRSSVLFALSCFEISSENRNILAHGRRDSADYDNDVFVLRKTASGPGAREVYFDIPLGALRECALEMISVLNYFCDLLVFLIGHRFSIEAVREFYGKDYQPSLPEKPQKPRKLNPRRPSADRSGAQPQPQPSPPSSQSDDQA